MQNVTNEACRTWPEQAYHVTLLWWVGETLSTCHKVSDTTIKNWL